MWSRVAPFTAREYLIADLLISFFFFCAFLRFISSNSTTQKGQFFPLLLGNGIKTTFRRVCEGLGWCDASAIRMGSRGYLFHGLLADDPRASICNSSVHGA